MAPNINFQVTPEFQETMRAAAEAEDKSVSAWLRATVEDKLAARPEDIDSYISSVARHYGRTEGEVTNMILANHVAHEKAFSKAKGIWSDDFLIGFQLPTDGQQPSLEWLYRKQFDRYFARFAAERLEKIKERAARGVPLRPSEEDWLRENDLLHLIPGTQEHAELQHILDDFKRSE